jgi:CRISPR-associated protein Cmr6
MTADRRGGAPGRQSGRGQRPPAGWAPGQREQERRRSGDVYAVPLPPAAREAWQRYGTSRCQNAGLVFDRFAPRWDNALSRQVGTIKQQGLNATRHAAERVDKPLVTAWNRRWEAAARFVGAEPFTATTDWRLITGLGRKGPLEVGFTFHRYGLPYLPASSVKGLARTAGLLAVAEALGEDRLTALRDHGCAQTRTADLSELAALAWALELDTEKAFNAAWGAAGEAPSKARTLAEDFRAIFGTTAKAGQAVFLDAIPASVPKLDLDIMNPHYPDYYRDGSARVAPTDWQNPNPVYFLTVAARTPFQFAVGWRGPRAQEGQWQRLRDQAVTWLRQGLEELGTGGKTGAGYGYFVAPVSPATPLTMAAAGTRPAAPVVAPSSAPPAVVEEREGTIAEYNVAAGRGRIRDDRTGEQVPFTRDALVDKGWTPGRRRPVRYAIQVRDGESVVVRVERRDEG